MKQKARDGKLLSTRELAREIQDNSSLKKGEVLHTVEELIELIVKNLRSGNRVKLNGLGTFHMTLNCQGSELEKDCTIKSISRVNIRFKADKEIRLVNGSNLATQSPNAVDFMLYNKDGNKEPGTPDDGGGDIIDPMG